MSSSFGRELGQIQQQEKILGMGTGLGSDSANEIAVISKMVTTVRLMRFEVAAEHKCTHDQLRKL